MVKFKPCPRCGQTAVNVWRILGTRRYVVECRKCRWYGKTRLFKRRAIRAWNRERVTADGRP